MSVRKTAEGAQRRTRSEMPSPWGTFLSSSNSLAAKSQVSLNRGDAMMSMGCGVPCAVSQPRRPERCVCGGSSSTARWTPASVLSPRHLTPHPGARVGAFSVAGPDTPSDLWRSGYTSWGPYLTAVEAGSFSLKGCQRAQGHGEARDASRSSQHPNLAETWPTRISLSLLAPTDTKVLC